MSGNYEAALYLNIFSGVSDFLDGKIARTWFGLKINHTIENRIISKLAILTHTKPSQQSSLGTALDPLADKINMLFIYSAFYLSEDIPPWLFWMFIGRDIALVSQLN